MKTILSIQSHVAFGYVGNRAATLPLQRLGFDVTALNTVQFSNHPGHGQFAGDVMSTDHIKKIIAGLRDLGVLYKFDAVLSGYMGDVTIGQLVMETVADIKKHNRNCIYCCDPVMGDTGPGLFVKPDIPPMFQNSALQLADILTPNVFELEELTGSTITSLQAARDACKTLHAKGVTTVLVTSLQVAPLETNGDTISMLASHKDGTAWQVTTPHLPLKPMPNGTGDLTAALYLGYTLKGLPVDTALALTAEGVFGVLEMTGGAQTRELALIKAQNLFSEATYFSQKDSNNMKRARFAATLLA